MTPFGLFHTALSLVAVFAGAIALVRDKHISMKNRIGKTYVLMTLVTCITALGIFHHGGFGKPHVLALTTLLVLGVGALAGSGRAFGWAAPYVETVAYSLTFAFHMIPAITETATRLPVDAPIVSGPDAPALMTATAVIFTVFLIGATVQVLRLRGEHRRQAA